LKNGLEHSCRKKTLRPFRDGRSCPSLRSGVPPGRFFFRIDFANCPGVQPSRRSNCRGIRTPLRRGLGVINLRGRGGHAPSTFAVVGKSKISFRRWAYDGAFLASMEGNDSRAWTVGRGFGEPRRALNSTTKAPDDPEFFERGIERRSPAIIAQNFQPKEVMYATGIAHQRRHQSMQAGGATAGCRMTRGQDQVRAVLRGFWDETSTEIAFGSNLAHDFSGGMVSCGLKKHHRAPRSFWAGMKVASDCPKNDGLSGKQRCSESGMEERGKRGTACFVTADILNFIFSTGNDLFSAKRQGCDGCDDERPFGSAVAPEVKKTIPVRYRCLTKSAASKKIEARGDNGS